MKSLFLSLCLYFSRSVYLAVRFGNGFPKHLEKIKQLYLSDVEFPKRNKPNQL